MHYHIFTNDLRYIDNDAISGDFVPIFHLNSYQISSPHASLAAIKFMISCLKALPHMNIYSGDLSEFIEFIISIYKPGDRFTMHKDYTLYALERESKLPDFVELINTDRYLSDPMSLLKSDGSCYKQFGAFYKNAVKVIRKVSKATCNPLKLKIKHPNLNKNYTEFDSTAGRKFDFSKLNLFSERDDMSKESLMLSKYMTFGCYSIREMYWATSDIEFKKQLIWREFYQCILMADPNAREYTFLDPRFKKFKWQFDPDEWNDFINCSTGVLIVDAAMRQLLTTSFMNNRARLIWATYCIKYLQIDPYNLEYGAINIFSKNLIDCSTSQNKLNFEWVIGPLDLSGRRYAPPGVAIAGRRMDISNEKTIKKHNAYAYIRKWLPEYKDHTDKQLREVKPKIDLQKRYELWISKCSKI